MKRLAVVVLAVVVSLFGGAEPSHAWARGDGGGHSGFRDHHHGFRGSRVFVGAHVFVGPGVFFGAPYWYPTPIRTPPTRHPSSSKPRLRSMPSHNRSNTGTTARTRMGTTRMSRNAQEAGCRSCLPRRPRLPD